MFTLLVNAQATSNGREGLSVLYVTMKEYPTLDTQH